MSPRAEAARPAALRRRGPILPPTCRERACESGADHAEMMRGPEQDVAGHHQAVARAARPVAIPPRLRHLFFRNRLRADPRRVHVPRQRPDVPGRRSRKSPRVAAEMPGAAARFRSRSGEVALPSSCSKCRLEAACQAVRGRPAGRRPARTDPLGGSAIAASVSSPGGPARISACVRLIGGRGLRRRGRRARGRASDFSSACSCGRIRSLARGRPGVVPAESAVPAASRSAALRRSPSSSRNSSCSTANRRSRLRVPPARRGPSLRTSRSARSGVADHGEVDGLLQQPAPAAGREQAERRRRHRRGARAPSPSPALHGDVPGAPSDGHGIAEPVEPGRWSARCRPPRRRRSSRAPIGHGHRRSGQHRVPIIDPVATMSVEPAGPVRPARGDLVRRCLLGAPLIEPEDAPTSCAGAARLR